jgi:type IV pilus assembly protein PilA
LARGFTLVEIMTVVVLIGLLAALAIPGFQEVQMASQDKAVLNDARQRSAAADPYYPENGVATVSRGDRVGAANWVKALNLVANETYPAAFPQGVTMMIEAVAGLRTITCTPRSMTSSCPGGRFRLSTPPPRLFF